MKKIENDWRPVPTYNTVVTPWDDASVGNASAYASGLIRTDLSPLANSQTGGSNIHEGTVSLELLGWSGAVAPGASKTITLTYTFLSYAIDTTIINTQTLFNAAVPVGIRDSLVVTMINAIGGGNGDDSTLVINRTEPITVKGRYLYTYYNVVGMVAAGSRASVRVNVNSL
jgi:hypothetical protein